MKKLVSFLCAIICVSALSAQTYYITGTSETLFGASWNPAGMALDAQEDGTYSKTFTTCVSGKEYQFKVTDGTWSNTWGYSDLATVPEGVTGNSDNNIVCTTYDANMTVVFNPTEGKITLTGVFKDAGTTTYYMKHSWSGGEWTWKELAAHDDGTYFIRDIYGGSGCNWNSKADDSNSKWISSPTLVGSPAVGDSAVFTLTSTTGDGAITITKIVSTDPAVVLTVTGDSKIDSEVTLSANAGNIEGEVTYKYYVKVGDGEFTALEADKYTFEAFGTYTFKVEALVGTDVKAESTKDVTVSADWYVMGSFNSWKSQPEYGMKKNAEGVYSLSFKLEAGIYEFKLNGIDGWVGSGAVNVDCSNQGWEDGKDNIKFTLGTEATVTITYDGEKICLTSTLGKFGEVVITSYTIVGDEAIVGANWITDNTNADMTDKGDGTWVWEIKDRELEAKDYNYKVVGNYAYAIYEYPAGNNNNKTLTIAEAGTYDIVYTFKPGETPELSAVATKHSSPVTGLQESVAPVLYTRDGRIYGADDMRIYTVLGLDVTNMNGQLNGIYVVKTQAGIVKVVVR